MDELNSDNDIIEFLKELNMPESMIMSLIRIRDASSKIDNEINFQDIIFTNLEENERNPEIVISMLEKQALLIDEFAVSIRNYIFEFKKACENNGDMI